MILWLEVPQILLDSPLKLLCPLGPALWVWDESGDSDDLQIMLEVIFHHLGEQCLASMEMADPC